MARVNPSHKHIASEQLFASRILGRQKRLGIQVLYLRAGTGRKFFPWTFQENFAPGY